MNDEILSFLQAAVETHLNIDIVYHGGRFPGYVRTIHPIKINGNALIVRESGQKKVKSLMINKIDLPIDGKQYQRKPNDEPQLTIDTREDGFQSIVDNCIPHLEESGWRHFEYSENNSLKIYKTRKNGTPLKYPDLSIGFEPTVQHVVYNPETSDFDSVTSIRSKPWFISAKNETTRYYSDFFKALNLFMEWITKYAPK